MNKHWLMICLIITTITLAPPGHARDAILESGFSPDGGQVRAGNGGGIQLLPAQVGLGAELMIVVSGQPPGAQRQIQFLLPLGGLTVLANPIMDRSGSSLTLTPLPDVLPGDYVIALSDTRITIASANLSVLRAPVIGLSPGVGVGAQFIDITVSGLVPGMLKVTFDGIPVIGPIAVTDALIRRAVQVPSGGGAGLPVIAENWVGDRLMGSASIDF